MKKNVHHRKDGRWEYSKQENGKRYYAIANTYRQLLLRIPHIKPTKTLKEREDTISFVDYFKYFEASFIESKKVAYSTVKHWDYVISKFIEPYFKDTQMRKLRAEELQKFINGITLERTREVIYQRIVRVLRKAYATGRINRDISLGLERPQREESKDRTPLTYDEQVKMLNYVKNTEIYAFYMFSVIVGSRRAETVKFNLAEDLDEEKKLIYIHGTKTKNAERIVYVTDEFIKFLKENMPGGRFEHSVYYYTDALTDIFRKLNIPHCLHELRHTCSANLLFLGAKDKYRQMQLGHSSIVTTNDIYTNIKENIPKSKLRALYGALYPNFDETSDETFDTK